MSVEEALARQVATASGSQLPRSTRLAACRELLWCVGTGIAGANARGSREIHTYVASIEGKRESTVLGYGTRVPAHAAGLANATFAKAYEYEDKLWIGNSHGFGIGMAVVPAALAVAEQRGRLDDDSVVTAIAAATDLEARLMMVSPHATFGRSGWNSAYLLAVFGAAAAAGRMLGLDAMQMRNALGLAFAQAAGNYQGQIEGVLGVRLQAGFAVRNGIMAAELAQLGLTGVREFLTGRYGLYPLYYGEEDLNWGALTDGLGEEYLGDRLGFKAYPCGLVAHGAIDALQTLTGYSIDDVIGITVYGDAHLRIMAEPKETRCEPRNFVEAQFSIPWVIACMALDGRVDLESFSDAVLSDERHRRLARLVEVSIDPSRTSSCVTIALAGGDTLRSAEVSLPRGHPDNPLSTAELARIFEDCARHGPCRERLKVDAVPEMVLRDDGCPDMEQTMLCLRGNA